MPLTRRAFTKGGIAATALAYLSPDLLAGSFAASKSLVVLQLMGGNDGLNTFIPYTDARYRAARPTIGIPDGNRPRASIGCRNARLWRSPAW